MSKNLRIHYIQHVPFEGPAAISQWAQTNNHKQTFSLVYDQPGFPRMNSFDWLVIMGGPMGVYDDHEYSWMPAEKKFIRRSIDAGKTVIGICLGAQFIADALDATVSRNAYKEIGWLPVELTPAAAKTELLSFLPACFTAFHWHGDTFTLPEGAVHLARSKGCENQAFLYNDRVLGLQFHLEATDQSVRELVYHCKNEIIPDKYIQTLQEILSSLPGRFQSLNDAMFGILDRLAVRTV